MDMFKVAEMVEFLSRIEKDMMKSFNEHNKLQKQRRTANISPLFVSHCVWKKHLVVTYIRPYEGAVDEVYVKEIASLLNPNMMKKGAFIISKYQSEDFSDGEYIPNGNSLLNSTDVYSAEENEKSSFFYTSSVSVPINIQEHVKCGARFSTFDIVAGGKYEYHGSLGLMKKLLVSLKELNYLTTADARNLCSGYTRWIKLNKNIESVGLLLIPCKATKPLNLMTLICYPTLTAETIYLHLLEVQTDVPVNNFISSPSEDVFSCSATYDILGDFKIETNDQDPIEETSLKIHFHWAAGEYEVMQQPPHSAKSVLQLQVTVGESRSAANEVYVELTALDSIFHSSQNSSTQILSSSSSEEIYEKLLVFKESVSDFSFYGNHDSKGKNTFSEKTDDLEMPMSQLIQQSFQRNDQDFTDKLWAFLRQTENIEELRNYLDEILSDIVDGTLQPAISPTNETRLARNIRRMYLADSDEMKLNMKEKILEFLSSEQSIQGLVSEIGFEKLRKDYFNFFITKELTSASNLQKLFKANSPIDLSILWKLHYCLEVVITPAIYLNLSHDCQSTLLKAAIDYYSVNPVGSSSPVFCLSLLPFHDSAASIHQTCEARQPISWQCGAMNTNKAGFRETSVLSVTSKNVLVEEETDFVGMQHDVVKLTEGIVVLPVRKT